MKAGVVLLYLTENCTNGKIKILYYIFTMQLVRMDKNKSIDESLQLFCYLNKVFTMLLKSNYKVIQSEIFLVCIHLV